MADDALLYQIECMTVTFLEALALGRLMGVSAAARACGIGPASDDGGRRKRARDELEEDTQLDTSPEAAERRIRRTAAEWEAVSLAHQLLRTGRTCTIRDLYYCGAGKSFRGPEDANRALRSVCNALGMNRHRLGFHASVSATAPASGR